MKRIRKTEYQPVPVRNTLLKMKDISEVMIDLAYSAALFNNKELAREVIELERKMDDLVYVLNMNLMLATRDREDAESLVGVSKIGSLTNHISDAAADIAGLVLNDIGIHPVVRDVFQRTEEHLARMEVSENSQIIGKTPEELDLAAQFGVDVIAIRRGEYWHLNPDKEQMMPGDIVLARGTESGLGKLREGAGGKTGFE